jgi:putative hemolysin
MNKTVHLLFLPLFLLADGEAVYEKQCASCHQRYVAVDILMKNFLESNNTLLHLKAPTLNQLSFRLKQMIGDAKGDAEFHKMEVTDFIQSYVMQPDRELSVCLPEVMKHFTTMPSLEGNITAQDLTSVAEWIYDKKEQ